MRRTVIAVVAVMALPIYSGDAGARAWPRLLMFYGEPMKAQRAHLTTQRDVVDFMAAIAVGGIWGQVLK
jgi:hypothetical protein